MDNLFDRNTNDIASNGDTETSATPQQAASGASTTIVNPLYTSEPAGEHSAPAGSPAPAPDARAYVAESAPQQAIPVQEHNGKQPGRAANLLLVATLAAVCGLAGGLAGGAIMSAATGGSAQATQGGMGGGQGGMQGGGMPGADGTTGDGTSEGTANGNAAPDGQAPTGTPDAGDTADTSADGSNDAAGDTSTDAVNSHATSQTSLSV